jgi:hypothetical protein
MTRRVFLPALGVLGIALVVWGIAWKWLHPPESYWSQQQAQALVDAFGAVHAAEDKAPHGPNDPGADEFLAARRRYDNLKSDLEQARTTRDRTGLYVALAGLLLLISMLLVWHFYPPQDYQNER